MKCLCGYEHIEDWEVSRKLKENPEFVNGDEEFLYSNDDMHFKDKDTLIFSDGMPKTVFACPKCGTLKIHIEEF